MKSFGDFLFISTLSGVYTLQGEANEAINISGNLPSPAGVVRIDVNDNYIIIGLFDYNFVKNEIWIRPTSDITSTKETVSLIPKNIKLGQNYPNPFNPSTKISWQSPIGSHQTLKVYDVLGNEVATLVDEYKTAGSYEVDFDAAGLTSGVYFYRLQSGSFVESSKMILLK
ncbi:MAG: T9SS type A sorting domain-containing protein [Ignavibacteriaceae bacterium]|nr:T9SS type A sorting domain-containing protein [Ignavibacteriaceae bacterium]